MNFEDYRKHGEYSIYLFVYLFVYFPLLKVSFENLFTSYFGNNMKESVTYTV